MVHFNRLKKCSSPSQSGPPPDLSRPHIPEEETTTSTQQHFGETLVTVDDNQPTPRRYPSRQHTAPDRFGTFVTH